MKSSLLTSSEVNVSLVTPQLGLRLVRTNRNVPERLMTLSPALRAKADCSMCVANRVRRPLEEIARARPQAITKLEGVLERCAMNARKIAPAVDDTNRSRGWAERRRPVGRKSSKRVARSAIWQDIAELHLPAAMEWWENPRSPGLPRPVIQDDRQYYGCGAVQGLSAGLLLARMLLSRRRRRLTPNDIALAAAELAEAMSTLTRKRWKLKAR
jgi:hypothetical protein